MSFRAKFETLVDIYEESIRSFAGRELFGTKRHGEWQWTTYREFGRDVERFRGALASLGIGKGDIVSVIANNRVEWAVAAYATYGLSAAYVPMYEAQTEKDWEFILRDCNAKVLIVSTEAILKRTKAFLDTIPSLTNIILLDGAPNGAGVGDDRVCGYKAALGWNKEAPIIRPTRDDIAGLIYTSGTTGNPKGVLLSHYNLASNVSAVHRVFPMERGDRSLSFLPWAHSFGQTCELHCLFSMGSSTAFAESVEKIVDNLSEVRPTLLFSVPRIFNRIYAGVQKQIASKPKPVRKLVKAGLTAAAKVRAGEALRTREYAALRLAEKLVFAKVRGKFGGRLRYAFSGGAAISREVAEFIDGLGVVVYEGYGLTETSPIATGNWPGSKKIGSVGRPIPGCRIVIDMDVLGERAQSSEREEGEVVIYGPNVMKGYHNRPEENAAVFTKDGGFRSGDMGYVDDTGFLFITGRIKEQYKLENGKYVVPTPLEELLKLSPFILNVMVHGDNRPHNVALVVANVPAVREHFEKQKVQLPAGDAVLEDARVRELFRKEISEHSAEFKGFEEIRDFSLISADFTTDNGMLTPSMKLKRRAVLAAYGDRIDALYGKGQGPQTRAQA